MKSQFAKGVSFRILKYHICRRGHIHFVQGSKILHFVYCRHGISTGLAMNSVTPYSIHSIICFQEILITQNNAVSKLWMIFYLYKYYSMNIDNIVKSILTKWYQFISSGIRQTMSI